MDLKKLKSHLYEENHSPFYVKYYALSNNQLQELMQRCGLINSNLSIKFTGKYIYFDKGQGYNLIKNARGFSNIGLLKLLTKEHLTNLGDLKKFCNNLHLPKEEKSIGIFYKYLELYSKIPAYDLLIHLIWSEKTKGFIKKTKLSPLQFFEITCPPKTIVLDTYLNLLSLISMGKQDVINSKYGWMPNLEIYTNMAKKEATMRKEKLQKRLIQKTKKHFDNINKIEDQEQRKWVLLFNDLQKWVNEVDFNERETDHISYDLFKSVFKILNIKSNPIELVRNILPEDIQKFKDESISVEELKKTLLSRSTKKYVITYSNKNIQIKNE
jgi:hypothetical protein